MIVPLYNEVTTLIPFYEEIKRTFHKLKQLQPRVLFVDDGSSDTSWRLIETLAKKDPQISAIKLSRNFGSHTAWLAGIREIARNKNLFGAVLLAIDLQDPPALILNMVRVLKDGVRVVWAARKERNDDGSSRLFARIYYTLVRRYALSNMSSTGMDFCLVDRQVVKDLARMEEKNTSLLGLILWLGYPQAYVPYSRLSRKKGKSHWTLAKKVKLFIDTFVAFSHIPIRLMSYLGFIFSGMGFAYASLIIVRRLLLGAPIEGWSSLMVTILILSGVQLIMLGIVAEYLWRTLEASRKRPMYLIDRKINV